VPLVSASTILVMAKEPQPGRVKTRLCPPCTPAQAADIAAAALTDTLHAVTAAGAGQVVLALDGDPSFWVPEGVNLIAQRGGAFSERLANAWDDVGGPAIQVGMDTPQITSELLIDALVALHQPETGAVLGPAEDGGWWLLGLRAADRRVFDNIAMSRPDTGAQQLGRLRQLELAPKVLPTLRDIDTFADAQLVTASMLATATATAAAVAAVTAEAAMAIYQADRAAV